MTKIFPIVLIFVGCIAFVFAFLLYQRKVTFLVESVKSSGKVIEITEKKGKNRMTLYAPIITYDDFNKTNRSFTGYFSRKKDRYTVGDEVPIRYAKIGTNYTVEIDSFKAQYRSILFLTGIGLALLFIGFWAWKS